MISVLQALLTQKLRRNQAERHQKLSYQDWENRFVPRHRRWGAPDPFRFDRNRDLW